MGVWVLLVGTDGEIHGGFGGQRGWWRNVACQELRQRTKVKRIVLKFCGGSFKCGWQQYINPLCIREMRLFFLSITYFLFIVRSPFVSQPSKWNWNSLWANVKTGGQKHTDWEKEDMGQDKKKGEKKRIEKMTLNEWGETLINEFPIVGFIVLEFCLLMWCYGFWQPARPVDSLKWKNFRRKKGCYINLHDSMIS